MQVKELILKLETLYKPNDHIAAHLWSPVDVIQVAAEIGEEISAKVANEIIDDIEHHIDSEYGVTWTTIKCVLQDYLSEEKANGSKKKKR